MKLLENIKLNDGTFIEKGTSIKMNYKEGPFLNVEFNEGENVKKIFWITDEQAKTTIIKNQVWTKKKFEEHLNDIKETWFEPNSCDNTIIIDSISSEPILSKKRGRPKKIK